MTRPLCHLVAVVTKMCENPMLTGLRGLRDVSQRARGGLKTVATSPHLQVPDAPRLRRWMRKLVPKVRGLALPQPFVTFLEIVKCTQQMSFGSERFYTVQHVSASLLSSARHCSPGAQLARYLDERDIAAAEKARRKDDKTFEITIIEARRGAPPAAAAAALGP